MPESCRRHPSRAEAISAYRDALLREASAAELAQLATALDAETVRLLEWFRAAQHQAEGAPPAFVNRLEQYLATAPGPAAAPVPGTAPLRLSCSHAVNGRRADPESPPRPQASRATTIWPRVSPAAFASLALLVLTLLISLVAFGPLRPTVPRLLLGATDGGGQLEPLWASNGGPAPNALEHPYGVGTDPQGQLWVADGAKDRFAIFAPDGTYRETWGTAGTGDGQFEFYSTESCCGTGFGDVAFDASGAIYVLDTGNQRVQKFAPERSFVLSWGSKGDGPGQFLAPGGIAVGPDGSIYVSDEQRGDVQRFDPNGRFLAMIGKPGWGTGRLAQPSGVAVSADGDIWVSDYAMHRINRFSPDGKLLTAWGTFGSKEGQLDNPNDVAVDQAGNVFVADENNNRLQVFTINGRFLAAIGAVGAEPGQFSHPEGVTVDDDGTVYVSDQQFGVQAFRFTRYP